MPDHRRRIRLILFVTGLITGLSWLILSLGQVDKHPVKVIGLPPDYQPRQTFDVYTGPHPSLSQRPAESFLFPIRPGQIGPITPLFAGPLQYPYICRTEASGLGQPLVDNYAQAGIAIYELDDQGNKTDRILGYSKDCSVPTQIHYYYKKIGENRFYPLDATRQDIEQIQLNGETLDFIVRVETGTINRHPYMIYLLRGPEDRPEQIDGHYWNRRLIYQFRGGVGIGKTQGRLNISRMLSRRSQQLAQGYAIVHSTANQTSNHYDIWLSEDTALRVKQQFITQLGKPDYTVGLGGSGGAIQQYLLGQNNPDVLDAAIALYSYPDMITKTPHILDCELLEYYFDVTDADNPKWSDWNNRRWIEGMNAIDGRFNHYTWMTALANLLTGKPVHISDGKSECVESWRGLTPAILNPRFPHLSDRIADDILHNTELNYWNSLNYIYGTDQQGNTHVTWDNQGVQYGLQALKQGHISIDEFLDLNRKIGSWKPSHEMQDEHYWFLDPDIKFNPSGFSVWSHHNMRHQLAGESHAPRTRGHLPAMQAAYRSGQVFMGRLNIPVIDLRHYLENELNMHHSLGSFSVRARINRAKTSIGHQVMWMTDKPHTPIAEALAAIDRWMKNIKQYPARSILENKPEDIKDSCFNKHGELIAQGQQVWDGAWNQKPVGECYKVYPPFSNSRIVAGEPITANVLKCQLQTISQAIESELYQPIDMKPYQSQLEKIFPQGVCDYSKPDMALPENLFDGHQG